MKRLILATSEPEGQESYGHLMIADALNRARVPFWTKAATVRSSSELDAALEIGGIDLVHFVDPQSASFARIDRSYPAVGSLFIDSPNLSTRMIDDLDLLDLILVESEELSSRLKSETWEIGTCLDVDAFSPDKSPKSRDFLKSIDDESKMLVSIGTETDLQGLVAELDEEIISDCNFVVMQSNQAAQLLDEPDRIIALLQHSEVLMLAEGNPYHPSLQIHASASGCPTLDCNSEDPREWMEQFVRIHRDWIRAGKVPRFPDEDAIENMRKTNGLRAYGHSLAEAYSRF
ncbi:MAG: hypothetical protein VYB30_00675 [Candidatus Thermoplasmatota archaeon]|nr:hypothetical protein [Candidatus Thermoplasmatota archaeon]